MRRLPAGAALDAVLYAGSAIIALAVPLTTDAPLDLRWAATAVPGYAAGGVVAAILALRRAHDRFRVALAVAVFAAVAAVPLVVHAAERVDRPRAPVKSDVLVVEQAAEHLLDGGDPYGARYDDGPLAAWPQAVRTHFPYLPGTIAFGMPRAILGPSMWTDTRTVSLAVALIVAVPALAASRASGDARLLAFEVLFVVASGAPLAYTSGKELPVLALLLAFLVALDRRRTVIAGAAAGLAVASHQLAWAVLPFVAFAATGRDLGRAYRSVLLVAVVVAVGLVAPFVAWNPTAFVDDAVLYPLGFGQADAAPLSPGGSLASIPGARPWVIAGLAVAVAIAAALLRRRVAGGAPADVALAAGALLVVALLFAPRLRIAYVAFPLNLIAWGLLVLRGDAMEAAPWTPSVTARTSTAVRRATPGRA